ncbi:MAG: LacI family DNA-binding transcriptional regulator [Oscillospiraceae bacterium]|nr:LacI family DNA-binding transcriptional regulator [Oscillospiraceae bacterium]
MDKKIRMADIAEALGVSVVSVSKALSGQSGVSRETREKVLELAREWGYVPLRTKKPEPRGVVTGNIGILVADRFFSDSKFYSNLYRHLLMCCHDHGVSALLELVTPEAERKCTVPAIIQGGKVDGLIFMGEIAPRYLQTITALELPYMLLDFYREELEADSVTSDNVAGAYRLTKHILDTGRKTVGFVGSIHATSSIMDRYLGYTKALLQAGIPVNPEWLIEDRDARGDLIPAVLPEHMPQAFLCSCDEVAYNLMEQLKRQGYRIPGDIAVAGYDDFTFAQIASPHLTTYRVDVAAMADMVVGQLVRKVRGKHVTKGNMVVSGRFIPRGSTAPTE